MPDLVVYEKEIECINVLGVAAGTNCPQGGDAGHGGRTVFRLTNQASTDLRVKVDGREVGLRDSVEILLGGDSEHRTFVEALEFALEIYKAQNALGAFSSRTEKMD